VSALKDMPRLSFRRFEERDTEGIRRIYPQFFEDCPELKDEEGFVVAEIARAIVGFVVVTSHSTSPWWDREISSLCEIEELHVYHKLWRTGIGTKLVQKALEYAKSKGAEAIYVGTGEDNYRARGLYEKCGFTEHRRLIRYRLRIQDSQHHCRSEEEVCLPMLLPFFLLLLSALPERCLNSRR
jgi:ribosomal protein S18 acetylase RimI-like enzyme